MISELRADLTDLLADWNRARGLPPDHGLADFLNRSVGILMACPAIRAKLQAVTAAPAASGTRLSA
jgi:hypothetical protein